MENFLKKIKSMSKNELTDYLKKNGIKFEHSSKNIFPLSIIAFDYDDVIVNFVDPFIELYEKTYNTILKFSKENGDNRIEESYDNVSNNRCKHIIDILIDAENLSMLNFRDGTIDVLNKYFKNRPLVIISKRNGTNPLIFSEYLKDNLPKISNIYLYITDNCTSDKLFYLHECCTRFFIDDKLSTCKYLFNTTGGYIQPIVYQTIRNFSISQNWVEENKDVKIYKDIPMNVKNWEDIDKILYYLFKETK